MLSVWARGSMDRLVTIVIVSCIVLLGIAMVVVSRY
jgi:hypothetical protein